MAVSQRKYVDLIENVATELQRLYTTVDINLYLRRFGIEAATKTSVSSKRLYVKDLLAGIPDDMVLRIAADLGLGSLAEGVIRGHEASPLAVGSPAPYAFISYQHEDREHAAELKRLLARIDVAAFLAHEDIEVSEEWRLRLLGELAKVTMFVAVLTSRYFESPWCVQESGIAAFRKGLVVVPLSYDGTVPQGFLGHYQAKRVKGGELALRDLLPSFLLHDRASGIDIAIRVVGKSINYRDAEANFQVVRPLLTEFSPAQIKALLEKSAANDQVSNASRCAKEYLPPLLRSHGHLLEAATLKELKDTCVRYGATV